MNKNVLGSSGPHPSKQRVLKSPVNRGLNYSDIAFPLDINDYEKTEDRFQMQLNAFGYENKSLSFIHLKKIL